MVSFSWPDNTKSATLDDRSNLSDAILNDQGPNPAEAEEILKALAGVFGQYTSESARHVVYPPERLDLGWSPDLQLPNLEARYRALVEQITAVVFMAYLDRGIGEAYVSPQTSSAGAAKRRRCSSPATRCARPIV